MHTQLRSLQLRLLHRIVPTNTHLFLCIIWDSLVRTLCNHEDVTIAHLFWSCHIIQQFWTDLAVFLKDKCVYSGSLTFSEIFILFSAAEKKLKRIGCLTGLSCWQSFTGTIAKYKSPHLL